jgi:hypothetical protein
MPHSAAGDRPRHHARIAAGCSIAARRPIGSPAKGSTTSGDVARRQARRGNSEGAIRRTLHPGESQAAGALAAGEAGHLILQVRAAGLSDSLDRDGRARM